jgi:hypothetical protein
MKTEEPTAVVYVSATVQRYPMSPKGDDVTILISGPHCVDSFTGSRAGLRG